MREAVALLTSGAVALCAGALTSCRERTPSLPPPPGGVAVDAARLTAFAPLPKTMAAPSRPATDAQVDLGRLLYYETRLSRSGALSCNSCHGLETFGVDNKRVSEGHRKALGTRNSPTVYNAAAQFAQFWDGRAADIEEQAGGPILNPIEMAMPDERSAVRAIKAIPAYAAHFKRAFPDTKDPITFANITAAIGAFERQLTTPSRWDKFLGGDATALTDREKAGFNAFVDAGCTACHAGALVGGAMYQKLGLVQSWPDTHDLGRYQVTKQTSDRMLFKVPSLRNVARTGPYLHDGSVATLDQALKLMARHQLGRELAPNDAHAITLWLGTLTGEPDAKMIARPKLAER